LRERKKKTRDLKTWKKRIPEWCVDPRKREDVDALLLKTSKEGYWEKTSDAQSMLTGGRKGEADQVPQRDLAKAGGGGIGASS